MIDHDPSDALASIQSAKTRLEGRARWSFGRHAAFGALMGGLVASYALPGNLHFVGLAICLIATGLIVRRDRRRDGFFVNGYRAGRTRPVTIVILLISLVALGLAMAARYALNLWWPPILLGVALAMVGTVASQRWERAYRAELRGDER